MAFWKTYGFDNDTKKYLDAVAVTGGSISYGSAQYVNQFVETCKASGYWNKLYDVGVFAGNDLNTALVKLKWLPSTSPYLVNTAFVAASYIETGANGGLQANGTSQYLNTQFVLSSFPEMWSNNHLSIYNKASMGAGINQEGIMGAFPDSSHRWDFRRPVGNNITCYNTSANDAFSSSSSYVDNNSRGHLMNSRLSPIVCNGYISGLNLASTFTTPQAASGVNLPVGISTNFNGGTFFSGLTVFYSIGLGLTASEASALYQAAQQLQTSLGRQIN